ncbi:MAG TPA: competence/damage-inducible protein A [Candidatus Deferrimicrobium sp.]|nr:competence/damage-inducible protein A [Candidatus Deferrimicrobium sp.]
MDAEIITIGDEIVTGHIVDTNAAYIAQQLTGIGVDVKRVTSVGDSLETMVEAFRLALKRAAVVVTTGGLGPTDDDITKKAIVKVFKRNLIFHEEVLADIRARYAQRGIDMPAINQNQALLPQGAKLFPNRIGSALGICLEEKERIFIALPGVPVEMKQILTDSVVPFLQGVNAHAALKTLRIRTTGIMESRLAEMISPGLKLEPGVRLAYLPSYGGIDLRIMASGESADNADAKAQRLARCLESVVGRYIYGGNDDTLEGVVGQLLKDNDKTLAVAESCTAGQLGMLITSVPGSSAYFVGGIVAYSNDVKTSLLSVDPAIIAQYGAVSEECAKAMADGCRKQLACDYALSVTGIAGPDGGTDDKPVGTTFIGLSSAHGSYCRKFNFGTHRESNRARASYAALELLRREILDIR